MTYQALQVMDQQDSSSPISEEEDELASIDRLLARANNGEQLTEEEYERIDAANFGPTL